MIQPDMRFGERFRKLREAKGVSGWMIEKLINFSRPNLSSMESGRYIPSDDVLKELVSIPELELTYTKLRAWKALEEYTSEELQEALNIANENKNQ